jgi:anti-sigma-K factor RskA
LVGFLETAALLGAAVAQTPPASLRRSILERIAVTPQLPPLTGTARHAAPEPPEAPPQDEAPSQDEAPVEADNVVPLRRPWYRRASPLIAAAVAAVVIGGGAIVVVNNAQDQGQQTAQTPEQCVATAADKKVLSPDAGQGTVTFAPSCNAATLDVSGLPDLPDNQTYQLWALAGETVAPRSLGLLPDASAGNPQLITAETKPGENTVAITAEPAGGSSGPTLPILWVTKLNT